MNSYLWHLKLTGTRLRLHDFRLKLVVSGLESSTLPALPQKRTFLKLCSPACSLGRRFPSYLPATPAKERPQHRCAVCSSNGNRKDMQHQCRTCSVALFVIPCFENYHIKSDRVTICQVKCLVMGT